ncbi:PH domain-containing protein [Planococcus salinarum]|uniref:hypothetical protein n=1 Tax=Planococcus salinarum TaxID=622695 RepID=UPI000E3BDFB2|nr:hypothetical protein [Planococcus salinarum]TAA66330.1 hypothetical protein D2909_15450 [Planococcus salinarum]
MAHPAKMLEELKEMMPNASIDHWIFGIFHTSRTEMVDGFKGLLAASEESLFFKSGESKGESSTIEIPIREVEELEADLDGIVKVTFHLIDGTHMEMSYVSRGNPREFIDFLQTHCGNLKGGHLLNGKSEH